MCRTNVVMTSAVESDVTYSLCVLLSSVLISGRAARTFVLVYVNFPFLAAFLERQDGNV